MADPVTSNLDLLLITTGSASGTWGNALNNSVYTPIDSVLGSTISVPVSSSSVALTVSQRQNLAFNVTGVLSNSLNITLPLSPNSTSAAVGGIFLFNNNTTGAFAITVKTVAAGSTGVTIPQGARSVLYSDGTNITFADDAQNQTQVYNGNPNGNVAGNAGSASTRADKRIDYSTNSEFLCTSTGTAGNAVWSVNLPYAFPSQGYITPQSTTLSPVLTADSIGASTLYLSAFDGGNLIFVYNGISLVPVPITGGQMTLTITSSQAANGIYDVMFFIAGGIPVVAFSPAWSTATAGSGARGSGAGTPQLTRVNGILVNAVAQTANNGASSYTIPINKGTYLGSVWIDSTQGQVTCHRSYGSARKFGVWNAYNRLPIILQGGDSTSNWSYTNSAIRASNNNSANKCSVFMGLPEEMCAVSFLQTVFQSSAPGTLTHGIGVNSTASVSGFGSTFGVVGGGSTTLTFNAEYQAIPSLGINDYQMLEGGAGSGSTLWNGTNSAMLMTATYNG